MAATKQTQPEGWFQKEILDKLLEVKQAVDESLQLGREAGESIRSLRKELGVDSMHGRLPQLDNAVARLDRRQEDDHKDLTKKIEDLGVKEHNDKNLLLQHMSMDKLELLKEIKPLQDAANTKKGSNQTITVVLSVILSLLCSSGFSELMHWIFTKHP